MSETATERVDVRPYSAADVVTPTEAARRLHGRTSKALHWLRAHDLVIDLPGLGERVRWGRVLDLIDRLADGMDGETGDPMPERRTVRRRLPSAGIWPPGGK